MLNNSCLNKDHIYKNELRVHTHLVEVEISERCFRQYGWELSKTDLNSFGKYFEKNAKWRMRRSSDS